MSQKLFVPLMLISFLKLLALGSPLLSPVGTPSTINVFTINSEIDSNMAKNDVNDYFAKREAFLNAEMQQSLGSDIQLNPDEEYVNDIFKRLKSKELENGFKNPYEFTPSRHFFEVFDKIAESKVFNLIKMMPKGAVLHAHDTGMASTDHIMNNILNNPEYNEILWYSNDKENNLIKFHFTQTKPDRVEGFSDWILLADARNSSDNSEEFDEQLRKHFTLFTKNPAAEFKDINEVWSKFINIFITLDTLVLYKPVWMDYFNKTLTEFLDDGVQYLEFRGLLPKLYDLDGKTYTQMDTFQIYYDLLKTFKENNPEFIGAKFIYGPNRKVDNTTFDDYMTTVKALKKEIPDFLAGFDLVAQEDNGNPLKAYIPQFLELKETNPEINFFFHAGETNWNGMTSDENLIDAILLDTKRIGHGYGIIKHPNVMNIIKMKNIAIEVNPISNQVLKLLDDNRNHPCTHFFADNYPIVISSDDPGLWGATPLSHDFYIAFMGIASAHSDLRLLKKLALNSIDFSSMNSTEIAEAKIKWLLKWQNYIEYVKSNSSEFQ